MTKLHSVFMIENDDGNLLDYNERDDLEFYCPDAGYASSDAQEMQQLANNKKGHLLEFQLAPWQRETVSVTEQEMDLLLDIDANIDWRPSKVISDYVSKHFDKEDWPEEEFRLMRAATEGYKIFDPDVYLVRVEQTEDIYYVKNTDNPYLGTITLVNLRDAPEQAKFTRAEIEAHDLGDNTQVPVAKGGPKNDAHE